MEKDIIQPVNISILNDMLKEQEQKYEKRIAELENKIYTLQGAFDYQVRSNGKINEFRIKYLKKLKKVKEYLEQREDIAKSMNELQTIQGIYNILEGV